MITTLGYLFTFPVEDIWPGGDTLQIKVALENTAEASLIDRDVNTYEMRIIKYGEIECSHDISQSYLAPLAYKFAILDKQGFLQNLIFDSIDPQATTVLLSPFIEIELYLNGSIEYHGYADEDGLTFDEGSKILSVSSHSSISKINNERIYDVDDVALDPLGYNAAGTARLHLGDMLLDIYQIADSSFSSVLIKHSWEGSSVTVSYNDLENLYIGTAYIFNQSATRIWYETLGDLLRALASDFFAVTGITFGNVPFYMELYPESPTSNYTLLESELIDRKKKIELQRTTEINITMTESDNTSPDTYTPAGSISSGIASSVDNRDIVGYFSSASPVYVPVLRMDLAGTFVVHYMRGSAATNNTQQINRLLGHIIEARKLHTIKNRVDEFVVDGLHKLYTDFFTYDARIWQTIHMKKNYKENMTTIRAVLVKEV